ncbi:MAG: cation transporter [Oscillospiraceae bacterium]|nr:cation transporter [Oscillospiraceae bacterium]
MKNKKSGTRTLLWSVIMSAPGPLVVGLGLIAGRSSTQLADFVRRSSELLAIIMAYISYRITTRDGETDLVRKARLERISNLFVGAMMCLGGSIMLVLAFASPSSDKGNVIPGLVIAVLGVIANTIFWIRYSRLNRAEPNPIIAVQARLYRAKSLVDACVTAALLSVAIAPEAAVSYWLDMAGSVIVAFYLVFCGVQTIAERLKNKE